MVDIVFGVLFAGMFLFLSGNLLYSVILSSPGGPSQTVLLSDNSIHAVPRITFGVLNGLYMGPSKPRCTAFVPRALRLQRAIPTMGLVGFHVVTE